MFRTYRGVGSAAFQKSGVLLDRHRGEVGTCDMGRSMGESWALLYNIYIYHYAVVL